MAKKLSLKGQKLMELFARDLENGSHFYKLLYRQAINKLGLRELAEEFVQDLYITTA